MELPWSWWRARAAGAVAALAALAGPLASDEAGLSAGLSAREVPYCQAGEPYAPDGMIIPVGSRHFRLCAQTSGARGERLIRVTLNPAVVPGLAEDYVLVALRLDDRLGFSRDLEAAKRGRRPAGLRMFDDMPYHVFDSGEYGPNGLPTMGTYVPVVLAAGGGGEPDHFIRCVNEANIPAKGAACSMAVRYYDVVSTLTFYDFEGDRRRSPTTVSPSFRNRSSGSWRLRMSPAP